MHLVETVGGSLMYPEYIMKKRDITDMLDVNVKDDSCSQTVQMQNHVFLYLEFYLQLLEPLQSTQLI